MHDLIKDINNYLKISGILWLYYGDDANDADDIINFTIGDDSNLFKFKQKNNKPHRWQWYKKCWNNGTIDIS